MRLTIRRLRSLGGLAAAIIPCALMVHLIAEAAATEREGISSAFIARHTYFCALFGGAVWWFALTVGLGRPPSERRRRCALLRADLASMNRSSSLVALVAANLSFFALTQAVERIPIASGAIAIGLLIALTGSLISALLVFAFGATIVGSGLCAVIGVCAPRSVPAFIASRERRSGPSRHATAAYSLFIPNRPPPALSHI